MLHPRRVVKRSYFQLYISNTGRRSTTYDSYCYDSSIRCFSGLYLNRFSTTNRLLSCNQRCVGIVSMSTVASTTMSMKDKLLARSTDLNPPVEVMIYPGSRVLSIDRPHDNNVLNQHVLDQIVDRVNVYDTNHTISAIFFTSYTPDLFSPGLDLQSITNASNRLQLLQSAHALTMTVLG